MFLQQFLCWTCFKTVKSGERTTNIDNYLHCLRPRQAFIRIVPFENLSNLLLYYKGYPKSTGKPQKIWNGLKY